MQLIECVPNFSEGINADIIAEISRAIVRVERVRLLNIDRGMDANRTVITFAGEPKQVSEAAFRAIERAGELIDMRLHLGKHPRIGATDVCPLVPIANISMQETVEYATLLAKRVGHELNIPVYLYEQAQRNKTRSNLSEIRSGQYEGFFSKIKRPEWQPDFGPAEFDAKRGATVIGARNYLVAYNINLDTTSVDIANAIAAQVRESGRVFTEYGKPKRIAGALKYVKAIGWYIKEYGKAQISMNLTNTEATPVHIVFDQVCATAASHGVNVTGSELIGLIPLKSMVDAGRYFLQKANELSNKGEKELIEVATKALGLDELAPFNARERIIEYLLNL